MSAIEARNLTETKRLVKSGVDPNFELTDGEAFSPIYFAISLGDLPIASWLLEEGGVKATKKILEWAAVIVGNPSMTNLVLSKLKK